MPQQKTTIWFIRFAVVCPLLLVVLLISFSDFFERYMQPILASILNVAGGGIICMIAIAPSPVSYYYYAGLMLVFMWGYMFIRLRFLWAALAGWVLVILYEVVVIWINPTPFDILINNNFFLISANALGMLASYFIEFYARHDFFLTQQLEIEREKVNKVNQELEERVKRRTADYQIINQALEQEIASHRQAVEALRLSEDNFRRSINESSSGVRIVTTEGETIYANRAILDFYGYDSIEELEMISPEKRYTKKSYAEFKIRNEKIKRGVDVPFEYTIDIIRKNGEVRNLQVFRKEILWNGEKQFQIIYQDITDRKLVENKLRDSEKRYRELSIVDDLTQLYNSRYFYHQLKQELDRLERHEYPLTLLLLDLDDFKAFNDTYGHIEGDQVLLRLGQVIKRCLRKEDSAYRYGGEEFTIILPMTTSDEGVVTAERIREELRKENFSPMPDKQVYLTVSIGVAQYKKHEDVKAFVNRVDHLMYQGKKKGKNRTCSDS